MKSDGTIWFTDPGYDSGLPGPPQSGFQPSYAVYRFYETNGNATVLQVTDTLVRPNGICLSPDETKLYVVDTGGDNPKTIKVYDVTSSNTVTGGTTFATGNSYDGIKCDVDGRVWAGDGTGVAIYAPDGHLIGKILFHRVANLCFGGPHYKTLYVVGQPIVTSIPVLVPGLPAVRKLSLGASGNQINLTWPAPSTGFLLEENKQLDAVTNWSATPQAPIVTNGANSVTLTATNNSKFYRLKLN